MSETATTYGTPPLQDIIAAMSKIRAMPPMPTVLTHPSNSKVLRDALPVDEGSNIDPLATIPIEYRSWVPPRRTRKVWHPPKGGRFVEYGPEDEHWMRPLGLGTVEEVDEGEAFYMVAFDRFGSLKPRHSIASAIT